MIAIIAETAAGISAENVGYIIAALVTTLIGGGVIGKKVADSKKVSIDGQPLSVEVVQKLATKSELADLEARIVAELKKFETALITERSVARTANGNLHARIDKTVESMMEMKGELHQINANLNRLVDLAMQQPHPHRKLP